MDKHCLTKSLDKLDGTSTTPFVLIFLALLLMPVSPLAFAAQCPAPPIESKTHANCLARQFVEHSSPPEWELTFDANESEKLWFVSYGPKLGSGIRGGGGMLSINKATGKVVLLKRYR